MALYAYRHVIVKEGGPLVASSPTLAPRGAMSNGVRRLRAWRMGQVPATLDNRGADALDSERFSGMVAAHSEIVDLEPNAVTRSVATIGPLEVFGLAACVGA